MFGRQRRPKPLSLTLSVLLPHQLHHPPSKLHWLGSRTRTSRTAVLQPLGPFLPIPLPQPLRLPVTHPHQARRIHHLQLFAFHSRQRFHSTQFLLAHPDSPHPASFRGRSLGDISIEEKRGHYHRGSTSESLLTTLQIPGNHDGLPGRVSGSLGWMGGWLVEEAGRGLRTLWRNSRWT